MQSYNGYSGELRAKAQRWLNMMVASKMLVRSRYCCACAGGGIIDFHAEDYSEPFTLEKTAAFPLCFSCHMAVHNRFRNPSSWDKYRGMVEGGRRFPEFYTRDFGTFIYRFTRMHATLTSDWIVPYNAPPKMPDALDVIDGWLLANTGTGWR